MNLYTLHSRKRRGHTWRIEVWLQIYINSLSQDDDDPSGIESSAVCISTTGTYLSNRGFLPEQGNGLKCTNPPPHRAKQTPKCTKPHLSGKATQKRELYPRPLGQDKVPKASQSPTHAPCFLGLGYWGFTVIGAWKCRDIGLLWELYAPTHRLLTVENAVCLDLIGSDS